MLQKQAELPAAAPLRELKQVAGTELQIGCPTPLHVSDTYSVNIITGRDDILILASTAVSEHCQKGSGAKPKQRRDRRQPLKL